MIALCRHPSIAVVRGGRARSAVKSTFYDTETDLHCDLLGYSWLKSASGQRSAEPAHHQPAQAANALTVGAFTSRVELPASKDYAEAEVVAKRSGGISPFTSTGIAGNDWAIKPDIVMEGGNLAISGVLPDDRYGACFACGCRERQSRTWVKASGSPLVLTREELATPRSAAEILGWVDGAHARFNTKEFRAEAREGKHFSSELVLEARPMALFANRYFNTSSQVMITHVRAREDRRGYRRGTMDAQRGLATIFIHLHVVKSRDASCVIIRHARLRGGGSWSTGIHRLDGYAVDAARTSWARRRAAPGEIPMKRLNARLNAASDW